MYGETSEAESATATLAPIGKAPIATAGESSNTDSLVAPPVMVELVGGELAWASGPHALMSIPQRGDITSVLLQVEASRAARSGLGGDDISRLQP